MTADLLQLLGVALVSFGGAYAGLTLRDWLDRRSQTIEAGDLPTEQAEAIEAWFAWNPWYLQSEPLRLEAQSIHVARRVACPDETLEENLAEISVEMYMRHPEIRPTIN